jgi:hypothetical protein
MVKKKKKSGKKVFMVRVEKELHDEVMELAAFNELPASCIIRNLLTLYLRNYFPVRYDNLILRKD